MGSCTLFVPPVYPLPPNGRVFGRFGVRPLHQKKRHPGIRGLSPGISFCREMPAKSYWRRKSSWFFAQKLEIIVDFYKIQKASSFPKNLNLPPRPKCTMPCPIVSKMGPPPRNTQLLDFFPANKSGYTQIRARAPHPLKIRWDN